jgi:membrane-associated phospholipid phosphatase
MQRRKLYTAEWLTIAYIIITIIYLLVFFPKVHHRALFFGSRMAVITGIGFLALLSHKLQIQKLDNIRQFLPFLFLGYWYSETFYFSDILFKNKDLFFFNLDERFFGCQPSMIFSQVFPQAWFSELMYFGYFSLYFFLFGIPLWFWFRKKEHFDRVVFVMMLSIFLYYSIFDMLPVVGPQFFLAPKDIHVPDGYLFCWLVRYLQQLGENPTGSFPSSHVGITVVILLLTYNKERKLFWALLPIAIILMLSTVYIKAHYLVDVLGGIITAVVFYWISNRMYDLLGSNETKASKRISSE